MADRRNTYLFIAIFLLSGISMEGSVRKKSRRGGSSFFSIQNLELVTGLGGTTFMGDLGGSTGKGTRFIKDYNFKSIRPILSVGGKLRTKSFFAFEADLNYGYLSGADKYSKEPIRFNRNLSFRSPIIEFTTTAQVYIGRRKLNNLYKIKSTRGRRSSFNLDPHPYVFAGLGFLRFNPQAKYEGKWVDLQPLGTEGQGLKPGFEKYSRNAFVIPFGIGVRNAVTKYFNIGLEICMRKSFTDYIDDVSTVYYDNDAIREARGDVAAYLADPNNGTVPNATLPDGYGMGAQRGGAKYNDYYGFVLISANYRLSKISSSRSKF